MPVSDNLAITQCKIQTITRNRPIFLGFTVLELSKVHMYDFHYNHMIAKYPHPNQLKLLFTDTDSLSYAVQTNNIYEDMVEDALKNMILASTQKTILYTTSPIKKPWVSLKMN